jgi:hypothetical protein
VKIRRMLLAMTILFAAGTALAGARWTTTIYVNKASDGSGSASGDVYSARQQPGYVYVGCYVIHSSGTGTGICQATDGTNSVYCYSTDESMMNTMRNSPEMSGYISFQWNSGRVCTYLYIDKNSAYYAKAN